MPIRQDVQTACDMLGLGSVGSWKRRQIHHRRRQGKSGGSAGVFEATEEAKNAQIIGEATTEFKGVAMQTLVGGKRIIARPVGDPVPRIC